MYEPLHHLAEFHKDDIPERIIRGSNRGGKTLATVVEIARAVTGQDPFEKYPTNDGRCFIVGKDGKHNSEVLYRKLFRAGAFKIIQDPETGEWRLWKPWKVNDAAMAKYVRLAPPLIPPRLVKEIAWENKKELSPNVVRMNNGWEIRFFSSLAKPPQGMDLDLVLFDEEIVNEEWYPEISARLLDRNGRFIWSATAQLGGYQLYDLCMQAADEHVRKDGCPRIKEYVAYLDDNPHITQQMKDLFFSKLTDEQRRVRIEGEFQFESMRVYPEFDWNIHGIKYFNIPQDWTRYVAIDPGRQVCAALFCAVAPPNHVMHEQVVFYDELYIRNCDVEKFGQAMREKTQNQNIRDFIIDHHGGRLRLMGTGGSQEDQLSKSLKKYGVRSQVSGYGFTWAHPDVDSGIEAVRAMFLPSRHGKPKFAGFKERLVNLKWEIDRYHYKKVKGIITDKPDQRHAHLMDTLRYLAMYDPDWHQDRVKSDRSAWSVIKARRRKEESKNGGPGIVLGPVTGKAF